MAGYLSILLLLIGIATTNGVPAGTTPSKFGVCQTAGKLTSLGYLSVSTRPERQVKFALKVLTGGRNSVDHPGAVLMTQWLTNFKAGLGYVGDVLPPNCSIECCSIACVPLGFSTKWIIVLSILVFIVTSEHNGRMYPIDIESNNGIHFFAVKAFAPNASVASHSFGIFFHHSAICLNAGTGSGMIPSRSGWQ